MRLSDLNPKITENGFLVFDCPNCKDGGSHRVRVPLHPTIYNGRTWHHSGNLETLSLMPSVDAGCWHGNIANGNIVGGLH